MASTRIHKQNTDFLKLDSVLNTRNLIRMKVHIKNWFLYFIELYSFEFL